MKKKTIAIVMAWTALVALVGYSSTWEITNIKGDELKGTPTYNAYSMNNNTGSVILYDNLDNGKPSIKLINRHMFNYNTKWISSIHLQWCLARVGIYDESKKLVKKGNIYVSVVSDKPDQGYVYEPKAIDNSKDMDVVLRKMKSEPFSVADQIPKVEIYDALCQDGWKVRIVADTYGSHPDFDVTVTADAVFKSIPWIPSNKERVEQEKRRALKDAENLRIKAELEKKNKEAAELKAKISAQIKSLEKERSDIERKIEFATQKGYLGAVKKYKAEISSLDKKIEKLKAGL